MPRATPEEDEQILLFDMLNLLAAKPGCEKAYWVHAVPNFAWMDGATTRTGKGQAAVARSLRLGKRPGVWDVFVPFPRQWTDADGEKWFVCGLYIEMKYGTNKLRDTQEKFQAALKDSYDWGVYYSAADAFRRICRYLANPYTSYCEEIIALVGEK